MRKPVLLPSVNDEFSRQQLRTVFDVATRHAAQSRWAKKWPDAVVSLHDREGLLFVCWRSIEDRALFGEAVKLGWRSVGEFAAPLHWLGGGPKPDAVW
jgi:hypothetical protein